jgi:hypothetical protein
MKRTLLTIVASLAVLLPALGWTVDVPVSYTVDDKELKDAVSGTNLTFSLYDDSACTSQIHTEVIAIDDVLVSRLKLFKPSGGAKPPKTAELRATLTNVGSGLNLYLVVTGTGVVAVGGTCQAQAGQGSPVPTCVDNIQNGNETDVDCGGGTCGGCQFDESCLVDGDCISSDCDGGMCAGSCTDGAQNQDETDIDCGGTACGASCQPGQGCLTTADCNLAHPFSIICTDGVCEPHCNDGQLNGTETDVDCGGACATLEGQFCPDGDACLVDGDCQSSNCVGNICMP